MAVLRKEFLDLKSVLKVNRPLEVTVTTRRGNRRVFKSILSDYTDDSVFIPPLVSPEHPYELQAGDEVTVVYMGEDALYEFDGTVKGKKKDNNLLLTEISNSGTCHRVQRRNFYRLDCSLKVHFRKGEIKERRGKRVFVASERMHISYLFDISAGGLAFYSKEKKDHGEFLQFLLELKVDDKVRPIKQLVKVLRQKNIPAADRRDAFPYVYGTRFIGITEEDQAVLMRFVMQSQIEERKKKWMEETF